MMMKRFYILLAMLLTNEYASAHRSHACEERRRTNALALMSRFDRLPFFNRSILAPTLI
jgi:hypothetical protein